MTRLDRRDDQLDGRIVKIEELAVGYQLTELRRDVGDIKASLDRSREEDQKERKDTRIAIYALIGVVLSAIITGLGAYLAAGVG